MNVHYFECTILLNDVEHTIEVICYITTCCFLVTGSPEIATQCCSTIVQSNWDQMEIT